jgi:hypothetical protein
MSGKTEANREPRPSVIAVDRTLMRDMVEEAIGFCARKARVRNREETLEAILNGDCSVCEYLRYGLAKQIGAYLGSMDHHVKTVYVYEPEYGTTGDDASAVKLSLGINLLAWVDRKSAALNSVIESLVEALRDERSQLLCEKANGVCFALDVLVVDDEEVNNRKGYGALVNSLYVRPTKLWTRTA